MPSPSSTPGTEPEPHWREDSKLDELLVIARQLREWTEKPGGPLVVAAGHRLVMFPYVRRGSIDARTLGPWVAMLGGGPFGLRVELSPVDDNTVTLAFCAPDGIRSNRFDFELCGP